MRKINTGLIRISEDLTIFPGYSFEEFKGTRFYKKQDGIKIIYLDGQQTMISSDYDARSNISSINVTYFS